MYRLINPYIEGTMTKDFPGKTAIDAAKNLWQTLTQFIINPVPKFPFTLENKNNGSLHHFIVKETFSKNDTTKFKISPLDVNLKQSEIDNLKSKIDSKMKGGMLFMTELDIDDDDELDDEEDDLELESIFSTAKSDKFKLLNQNLPISYWWYDPLIYQVDSIYVPTFAQPLTPYIEIATINYYP